MFDAAHGRPASEARARGGGGAKPRAAAGRALLLGCLVLWQARATAQTVEEAALPWLPAQEHGLLERSFSRCLKATYQAQNIPPSEGRIARAWSNDLDQLSGSLTADDIRRAPQETVAGLSFIRCSWFSARVAVP